MKGKLRKNEKGEWYIYKLGIKDAPGISKYLEHYYPLHPYEVEKIERSYKLAGDDLFNVEFDFKVEPFWETGIETPIKMATLIKFLVEPTISDDFQIGPDGAYEHTDGLDSYHYHEVLDRLTIVGEMIERLLIDHPVLEKHTDLRDTVEKAQDLIGDAYLTMGDLKMKLDIG